MGWRHKGFCDLGDTRERDYGPPSCTRRLTYATPVPRYTVGRLREPEYAASTGGLGCVSERGDGGAWRSCFGERHAGPVPVTWSRKAMAWLWRCGPDNHTDHTIPHAGKRRWGMVPLDLWTATKHRRYTRRAPRSLAFPMSTGAGSAVTQIEKSPLGRQKPDNWAGMGADLPHAARHSSDTDPVSVRQIKARKAAVQIRPSGVRARQQTGPASYGPDLPRSSGPLHTGAARPETRPAPPLACSKLAPRGRFYIVGCVGIEPATT